jgi:hypothetical protein
MAWNRRSSFGVQVAIDDIEHPAIRDEGHDPDDPDDPDVVAALDRVRATLAALSAHPLDCECQECIAAAKARPADVAYWCRRWQR